MGRAEAIPVLVSEAEYLSLPETTERRELVDGEVIVPRSPDWRHQLRVSELLVALRAWADGHRPAFVGLAPLDVRLGPDRIVQPDLFVILAGLGPDATMPLDVVPDLVVEVLSSERAYDRLTKRALYAQAGVREYWIVDGALRRVEVHRPGDEPFVVADRLVSPLLPDFVFELARLW